MYLFFDLYMYAIKKQYSMSQKVDSSILQSNYTESQRCGRGGVGLIERSLGAVRAKKGD